MDTQIKETIATEFTDTEAHRIVAFLNKGFSQNGQIAIASIFLYAKEHRKAVFDVLRECEKEWERNWNFQHPDLRGNPDAPGGAGLQNRASLENIYAALGVPSPLAVIKKAEVPTDAFVVRTRRSIYRFGRVDEDEGRAVSRDGEPLDFTRCRITFLSVGQGMELECLDGSHPHWYTSNVQSIE